MGGIPLAVGCMFAQHFLTRKVMPNKYYRSLSTVIFILLSFYCFGGSKSYYENDSTAESSLDALKSGVQLILNDHSGLCAGIALLNKNEANWIAGVGKCNSNKSGLASEKTIFRIASLSKIFVALSILKLQEEGKLDLQDKIIDIIPEIKFENPWQKTDPIRVVHLLENTSGWDEIHLVEMAHNETPPISLKQALDFHPHSRKSRWVPGSRKSYTNTGYAVAGYIVQKVSGLLYEEYVREAILKPLKMEHTTFFHDQLYQAWGADSYNWAMEKVDYKHELYRPTVALNSSTGDMANLLKMLLNRGSVDTLQFLEKASIQRMETPKSTPGAKAGLELGYGLGNVTSNYKNFIYYGHEGAMDGGLSELKYLPGHGVGYVILLNASNGQAMHEISMLIKDFQIGKLQPIQGDGSINSSQILIEEGYYVAINPRNQNRFYQDLVINIEKIEIFDDHITRSWIVPGGKTKYYPVSPTKFILEKTGKVGLVEAKDPLAGKVLYTDDLVLKPISSFRVFGQLSLVVLWIVNIVAGLLIFGVLGLFYIRDRKKYTADIRVSLFPTLASLFLILVIFLSRMGFNNADLFSKASFLSVGLMGCSIFFAVSSFVSVVVSHRLRKLEIHKIVYWPMMVLSCLHLLVSIYLIYFGVIPMMKWV